MSETSLRKKHAYWKLNIRIMLILLALWALCSYGFGIVFRDALDAVTINGVGLGLWFAQQGSIVCFLVIIYAYAVLMHRLDKQFGLDE